MTTSLFVARHFVFIAMHPIIFSTLLFIMGIWWQSLGYSFYIPLFFYIFMLCIALIVSSDCQLKFLLYGAHFILGNAMYQSEINRYIWWQQYLAHQKFDIVATIDDIEKKYTSFPQIAYYVQGILTKNNTNYSPMGLCSHPKNLILYSTKPLPYTVADNILIRNAHIQLPDKPELISYFIKENIAGTILITNKGAIKHLSTPRISLQRCINNSRNSLYAHIKKKMPRKAFNFFSLLFFGNKAMKKNVFVHFKDQYKKWGISHYLARSGLHLSLIMILWDMILSWFLFSFWIKQLLLCSLTCIYALLSWSSTSFLRSFFMFILYKIGIFLKRQIDVLHIITISTYFFLLYNPFYLFFLDFQLSFGITFLLAWINRISKIQKLIQFKNT